LSGVSVAPNGTLYVADTGLKKLEPKEEPDPKKADPKAASKNGDPKKQAEPEEGRDPDAVAAGLEPSGTDAVWQISKYGSLKRLSKGEELHQPFGLAADDSGVWVASWLKSEIYRITKWGKRNEPSPAPSDQLQGMVRLPDGATLLSSAEKSAVYIGHPGGAFNLVMDKVSDPGGLGYDSKRRRVLIPLRVDGTLMVQELSGFEETSNSFEVE